jgi:hypothetical protein
LIFRCTRSPRSNSRAGTMFHYRHGGKRKAPGRLSPGPAVPLLTRGLIWDRHAKHAHRIGHFWAWHLQCVHISSLLPHRYSQARAAACIGNTHSVPRRRAHAGDGARSLLILSGRSKQSDLRMPRLVAPIRGGDRRKSHQPSACAFSRMAVSDIAGVSASGSTLRCRIAGLPDFCAASKAGRKSAVFSTVAP